MIELLKACNAARQVLQLMENFETEVEAAECRIRDACSDVVDRERELDRKMRREDENHPDKILDFWKHMECDLTTALEIWKRKNDSLEKKSNYGKKWSR